MPMHHIVDVKTKRVNFRRSEIEEALISVALKEADIDDEAAKSFKFKVHFYSEDTPHHPTAWVLIVADPSTGLKVVEDDVDSAVDETDAPVESEAVRLDDRPKKA